LVEATARDGATFVDRGVRRLEEGDVRGASRGRTLVRLLLLRDLAADLWTDEDTVEVRSRQPLVLLVLLTAGSASSAWPMPP
jgi:hypothetical protein